MQVDAQLGEAARARAPDLVITERGEELAAPREQCQLARSDGSPARRFRPGSARVDDLTRRGQLRHPHEFDPFGM